MSAAGPSGAGRREWIGLAALALPCAVYAMDLTVLNLALPAVSRELHPTSTQLLWIVDIYGFLVAGLLITMGTLGDRIGRRRLRDPRGDHRRNPAPARADQLRARRGAGARARSSARRGETLLSWSLAH